MNTLAEALDKDIEEFMESLPKRPYKDGWAEDRWQEEMEKHPFFRTTPLDENEELPPLIEGLQQLKYDENENTPDELANTYKVDGNFSFKYQKYRDAIANYSAGLKCNCSTELKATLYNNRAAANFFLQNYRSALNDSDNAIKLNPNYVKAKIRIAQCYYFLKEYGKCVEICDNLLFVENNHNIVELRKKALNDKKIQERDLRKLHKNHQKVLSDEKMLCDAIVKRKIKFSSSSGDVEPIEVKKVTDIIQLLPTNYGDLPLKRVHLEGDELVWPVTFLYPVYDIFDCVQEFKENDIFEDHLNEILSEHREWDVKNKYKLNMINIYFKDENNKPFKVGMNETLKQVFQHRRFVVTNGIPSFFILPTDSEEENNFLTCIIFKSINV